MGKKDTVKEFLDLLKEDHDNCISSFNEAKSAHSGLVVVSLIPTDEQTEELNTLIMRYAEMRMDLAHSRHEAIHLLMEAAAGLSKDMEEKNV